ncbi:MAG TPA: YciI family protein [Candidatus Competibacter sp.]|nr:hypothetical protein [Candidatus Competibacteraceae bacterium]HRE55202.1 YciI family protein [Candidatus Competibacter sp.]
MRFLIVVKATPASEAGVMPPEPVLAEMAAYNERLTRAGVLLDAAGLRPSAKGWRIRCAGRQRTVIDGPFADTQHLIAGYTLIQAQSRAEALEWSRRFPNPAFDGGNGEIEVRQLVELEAFGLDAAVGRWRELWIER